MIWWNFNKKPIREEITKVQERINFSVSANVNGTSVSFLNKPKAELKFLNEHDSLIVIQRDLRTNNIAILFKPRTKSKNPNETIIGFFVNHKYWALPKLEQYKTPHGVYKFTPENILKGDLGRMDKLIKVGFLYKRGTNESHRIEVDLSSHESLANSKIVDKGGGVEISTVSEIVVQIHKRLDSSTLEAHNTTLYDTLWLKPIQPINRRITNLYDVYELTHDTLKWSKQFQDKYLDDAIKTQFHGLNIDYHPGKFKGVNNEPKSTMKVIFQEVNDKMLSITPGTSRLQDKEFVLKGAISLDDSSYYNYDKKTTIIGTEKNAIKGYLFPYSKKGVMNTLLTFSPNVALKNINIAKRFNFLHAILDKNIGFIKLQINNVDITQGKLVGVFNFTKEQQQKIILSNFSLDEMASL